MLKEFITKFTEKEIIDEEKIVNLENEFYSVPKELKQIFKRIEKKPVYIGEYLGKSGTSKFIPSLYLLKVLNEQTEKKVLVNDKGAWLFICGRDIMKESVIELFKNTKKDELLLVINKYNECLGVGILKSENKCLVKNYFDIGDFLRRERRKN